MIKTAWLAVKSLGGGILRKVSSKLVSGFLKGGNKNGISGDRSKVS